MLLSFCTLQSCKEEQVGVLPLLFQIGIVDMEGNDLLDPSFEGNIVSRTPTMIDIWGNEVKSAIYTDESFLYSQGKGYLIIDNWKAMPDNGPSHYILPGGPYFRSFSSNGWFEDKEIIIKWGGDIENDTIVFSGGWEKDWGPGISRISINGKELEHSKDIAHHGDYYFIYRKDISPKK